MLLSEATKCIDEGRRDRDDKITVLPYNKHSPEASWYARGWLERHSELKGEVDEHKTNEG